MSREDDVQKLCREVLSKDLDFFDNPNGGSEYMCPFCYQMRSVGHGSHPSIDDKDFPHKIDCGYLIAKDLMTNIK
jgi:hypothetical protein